MKGQVFRGKYLPHMKSKHLKNHGQTFEELARRGGLCYAEAYYILKDMEFATKSEQLEEKEYELEVLKIVRDFYINQ